LERRFRQQVTQMRKFLKTPENPRPPKIPGYRECMKHSAFPKVSVVRQPP